MARTLQSILIEPPIAVARLGGSNVPQDAYDWAPASDPHRGAETVATPWWSLDVRSDGTVSPRMPQTLQFRDGDLIRPVAPFFEVWAVVGEAGADPGTWQEVPLTLQLLEELSIGLDDITVRVEAINAKAARRTGNQAVRFGTFPPVEGRGDQHVPVPLEGVSPPGARPAMIPRGRSIPLGSIQVLRPQTEPAGASRPAWADDVRVDVVRLRFTPATGLMYGPPAAANPHRPPDPRGRSFPVVQRENAFLNPESGWGNGATNGGGPVQPWDTYDGADVPTNVPLGIVDDTCEARIEVRVTAGRGRNRTEVAASANVFVSPPDFAPDRRPFLSLADELNDRVAGQDARSRAMTLDERERWVEDVFERIFETLSLFNVDFYRLDRAAELRPGQLGPTRIADDELPGPARAMGGRDRLRNQALAVAAATDQTPLPLSHHARNRHRQLSDLQELRMFVRQNPGRLAELIRAPFAVEQGDDANASTMQMPPFMRQSNAYPLTLSVWQYELLMRWVREVETVPVPLESFAVPAMSPEAATRMDEVLRRVERGDR